MARAIIKEKGKKYIIDNPIDLKIFRLIKKLELKDLSKEDKKQVGVIKTQLEKNWGKYLLIELNKIAKKNKLK